MRRLSLLCLLLLLALCGSAQARTSKLSEGYSKAVNADYGQSRTELCSKQGCLRARTQWDGSNLDDLWLLEQLTSPDPEANGLSGLWMGSLTDIRAYWRIPTSSCFSPGEDPTAMPVGRRIGLLLMPFEYAKEQRIGPRRYRVRSARGWKPKSVAVFTLNPDKTLQRLSVRFPKQPKQYARFSFQRLDASPRVGAALCS